ncbi:hypothetical protein OOK27_27010 [Streptomyces canus]|uniref:hypothetical protein n=1 Tax=Streptomyces canus TaxID=58343 RepID=UPI002250C38F|nr:hypothetical protein [Streptomyces canus]MCX5257731.1 hypothetical protein [Streptomyces canus]
MPRHLTEYLLAADWSNRSVPGYPHVLLESPDQQRHLTLEQRLAGAAPADAPAAAR